MGLLYPATRSGTNNKHNTITGQAFAYQASPNKCRQRQTQDGKEARKNKKKGVLGVGEICVKRKLKAHVCI